MLIIWKWWESKAVPVPPQGSDAEAPWFIRHTVRVLGVAPTRTPVQGGPPSAPVVMKLPGGKSLRGSSPAMKLYTGDRNGQHGCRDCLRPAMVEALCMRVCPTGTPPAERGRAVPKFPTSTCQTGLANSGNTPLCSR